MDEALQYLEPLTERGKIGSLNNVRDVEALIRLADDIRDAIIDYQVRTRALSARSF